MPDATTPDPTDPQEDPIRDTVARLSRPHPRGSVIERAAILAEGAASAEIVEWIVAHAGEAETAAAPTGRRGLHGANDTSVRAPLRYVLPAGTL
jgi:hypothetical protein